MRAKVAIIGGTGIGPLLERFRGDIVHVPTPYGLMRCQVFEHEGCRIAAIQRHSSGHSTPPHRVNYRAIAWGVRAIGAKACFSSAAVGALREDWSVGSFAVCSDFIDFTGRNLTLCDREVRHTDFSQPFSENARQALIDAVANAGASAYREAVYVNGNGPRYETPREVSLYREFGGDIVGMTAATETILMGEAGVPYACLAVVANFACGLIGASLSHEEVVQAMEQAGPSAVSILLGAATIVGGWP